jgi:hypothetical protein
MLGVSLVAIFAAGCASDEKMIISDPAGAAVSINGQPAGITPLKYTFDFSRRSKYEVAVTMDGYIGVDRVIYSETPVADESQLRYELEQDPAWAETAVSDAANQWQQINISPDYNKQTMWPAIVQSVTARYSGIELMDPSSCYIRTLPNVKTYKTSTGEDNSLRTYLVGSMYSASPLIYQVKIVSERTDGSGNWVPWQRVFREDAELIEELQQRLGIK